MFRLRSVQARDGGQPLELRPGWRTLLAAGQPPIHRPALTGRGGFAVLRLGSPWRPIGLSPRTQIPPPWRASANPPSRSGGVRSVSPAEQVRDLEVFSFYGPGCEVASPPLSHRPLCRLGSASSISAGTLSGTSTGFISPHPPPRLGRRGTAAKSRPLSGLGLNDLRACPRPGIWPSLQLGMLTPRTYAHAPKPPPGAGSLLARYIITCGASAPPVFDFIFVYFDDLTSPANGTVDACPGHQPGDRVYGE